MSRPWSRALLLWLVACTAPAAAEDAQIWHWWTNEIALGKKLVLIAHGQFRTRRPLGEFLQGRTGPILRYYLTPRTTLAGGYYIRRELVAAEDRFGHSHRFLGGFENYKFLDEVGTLPNSLLETRTLVERFAGGPRGTLTNYTRFRHRNRFSFRDWRVSPLLGYEIFFFPKEFWGHRPHAGVRWAISPKMMLDIGYYWDGRQPRAGARNHLIFTNLLIRFKPSPDPDFPNRPSF